MVNKLCLAFILVGVFSLMGIVLLDYNQVLGLMTISVSFGILIGIGLFATTWYDRKKEVKVK